MAMTKDFGCEAVLLQFTAETGERIQNLQKEWRGTCDALTEGFERLTMAGMAARNLEMCSSTWAAGSAPATPPDLSPALPTLWSTVKKPRRQPTMPSSNVKLAEDADDTTTDNADDKPREG